MINQNCLAHNGKKKSKNHSPVKSRCMPSDQDESRGLVGTNCDELPKKIDEIIILSDGSRIRKVCAGGKK